MTKIAHSKLQELKVLSEAIRNAHTHFQIEELTHVDIRFGYESYSVSLLFV